MALFFDAAWFEARLKAANLSRDALAAALDLNQVEIAELWKDQRELSAREVRVIAGLIGTSADDVALHAGVSTPVSKAPPADLEARLAHIERELEDIKAQLNERAARR